ncbi:hypothetical protein HY570_01620, partial [Candidatus Micrarchaeota archaeon]|nr:hypothetical protein [Candidatus Micrarchaeota archaeon]
MKFLLTLAVLLLCLLVPFAQVTIAITEPQNNIFPSVANCKISGAAPESKEFGTPSEVTIKFNINNPTNDPYDIIYEVYDFPTQTFSTPASSSVTCLGQPISWGGKITIGPRVFTTCTLTFPIILGSTGNGTVTQELLRIHTNEQNNPSNVQTIPLTFQVDHLEISKETTLQDRKSEIQELNQATN